MSRLSEVASDEALTEALSSVSDFRAAGHKLVGHSAVASIDLISFDPAGDVEVYACHDLSGTDVVDASGASIVSPNRPVQYPMHVSLSTSEHRLVVNSAEVWSGDDFCA